MVISIEVAVTDFLTENTYFFIDDKTKHGFLIDPGAQAERILKIIDDKILLDKKI